MPPARPGLRLLLPAAAEVVSQLPFQRGSAGGSHILLAPTRLAASSLLAAVLFASSCAGSQAPWDVAAGDEARFQETSRICRLLTDDSAGELVPERFDKCMARRGWKRQGPIKRLFRGD